MSWRLQSIPAILALAAYSVISAGCGSAVNLAQVRVINAIPDSDPTDIYVNGVRIVSSLAFGAVQPPAAPARYVPVHSGNDSIQGFAPGDTINPIAPIGTIPLNGSTDYTLIAVGLELNESPPLVLTDDNTTPLSGNVEFRIVNVSLGSPAKGLDVYIVPPGTDIAQYTPQVSALGYGQTSLYQSMPFLTGGYSVIITANGSKVPLITQAGGSQTGSITTLVILDNTGGNGMSTTPLVLNDLD